MVGLTPVLCFYDIRLARSERNEKSALVIHVRSSRDIMRVFEFEAANRHANGGSGPRAFGWRLLKYLPANGREKF